MKTFLHILIGFIIVSVPLTAKNYYLSNAGNDAGLGTSSATAWQTLAKISAQNLAPGDTIFLRRGDTFRGTLTIAQSGTAAAPIVVTAFGTGSKPIISGAEQVKNWTLNGTTYQASFTSSVSNFFVNDREQTLARYPNDRQYLSLDTATQSSLTDAALSSLPTNYLTGSRICIHTAQWCWEKTGVGSFSAGKITYTQPTQISAIGGYGYFLYDNINLLDTAREWKYDASGRTLYYKSASGQDPNAQNCEATVYGAGIQLKAGAGVQNIVVTDITFEKQFQAGVVIDSTSSNIRISTCEFYRQYNYGVELKGRKNIVEYSFFREVDGIGIMKNGGTNDEIHHNTFRNIGQFRNSGIGQQINLSAITIAYRDSCYIHHNNIDSTGYCGISVDAKYCLIERNIISHAMLINNDGAALKSFGDLSAYNTFRNNFVFYSDGNTEGTRNGTFLTPAIYFDFKVNNSTIQENTVVNHTVKGIFQNSGNQNNTIIKNVIFGSNYGLDLNGSPSQERPIIGEVVKQNIFIAADADSYLVRQVDYTGAFTQGTLDSNYYFQPFNPGRFALRIEGTRPVPYNFAAWQSLGNDKNSKSNTVSSANSLSSFRLFMNPTDNDSTISLKDTMFVDVENKSVCGSITLKPYTSRVLVVTNQKCASTAIIQSREHEPQISISPNPASDIISIHFTLPKPERVAIRFYNTLGVEVASVLDTDISAGEHTLEVNTQRLSLNSATYFLRLQTSTFTHTQAVQVLR